VTALTGLTFHDLIGVKMAILTTAQSAPISDAARGFSLPREIQRDLIAQSPQRAFPLRYRRLRNLKFQTACWRLELFARNLQEARFWREARLKTFLGALPPAFILWVFRDGPQFHPFQLFHALETI
jgi:hypothetical protein